MCSDTSQPDSLRSHGLASQSPLFMGFSRQECWSGLPCPPLEDLPDPGTESMSLMNGNRYLTYLHWIYLTDYKQKSREGLPWWLSSKESVCSAEEAGHTGSIPGSGRGNGNPLQYSCLRNPIDRGAWWAIVHGVPKSRT